MEHGIAAAMNFMMSLHRTAVLLVIVAGLLTSIEAKAQARGRPATELRQEASASVGSPENRAQQLAELNAWLGRLAGRFQARSSFTTNEAVNLGNDVVLRDMRGGGTRIPDLPQQYRVNCTPVGSGPGLSCLYEATDRTVGQIPLAFLLGVDADRLGIRILKLDSRGYASEKFGTLRGDTVIFESDCPAAGNCRGRSTMRVRAPLRSRTVEIFHEADVELPGGTTQALPINSRTELRRE
jgi:hypothetical protein